MCSLGSHFYTKPQEKCAHRLGGARAKLIQVLLFHWAKYSSLSSAHWKKKKLGLVTANEQFFTDWSRVKRTSQNQWTMGISLRPTGSNNKLHKTPIKNHNLHPSYGASLAQNTQLRITISIQKDPPESIVDRQIQRAPKSKSSLFFQCSCNFLLDELNPKTRR